MSQSKTPPKGDDKAAKRTWAQRVFGWKKGAPTQSQSTETINPAVFVLAHQFGDLMRDPSYAELPGAEKAKLRQPVEQAIAGKDEGKIKTAIATFKVDLKKAREEQVKSVNQRVIDAEAKVNTLTSRGSPGAKTVATLLAVAKKDATEGRVGAAAAQLDTVEAAIVDDVAAHLGLAAARINSLSDWHSPEAGGLDNRLKAIRSKSTIKTFDDTLRDYDTLMRDIVAAATVPVQEQKTRGIGKLRDGMVAALAGVPDGTPKTELQKRFDTWDKALTAAGQETDGKKKNTALDTLDKAATKLYADILKAKGGDTKAEKEAVFKEALEARYGFSIDTQGRDFTNLDKMYDVLKLVPPEDVAQSKLKTLTYLEPGKGGAAYGGATIYMGDYGDAKGDWNYQNPDGTPAKVNGFNISALHELGHSIDDRHGIMSSNQGKSGCGGWQKESVASVTDLLFTPFKFGPGKDSAIPDAQVRALISDALVNGTPAKPNTISDTDWAALKVVLDRGDGLRDANNKWPWANPTLFGSRAVHQAYAESNEWWSYDPGARSGTTVRVYQWRSPAEWFAELYAFSNFKKQKPPSGIDAGVAVFMWKS